MKQGIRSGREFLSRLKLKVLTFLLSIFGGAALSSCFGLYYPPVALYMPPAGETVEVSGQVLDSSSSAPIPGIQVEAMGTETPPDLLGSPVFTDANGNYDLSFQIETDTSAVIVGTDIDGPTQNGSYANKSVSLGTIIYDSTNGLDKITKNIKLDPAAGK
jgi:hypothetical protein